MQILIEIPKEYYEALQEISDDNCIADMLIIKYGTPLPEHHGRMIDADTLDECKEMMNTIMGECEYAVRMDDIRNVPTIIPATKEGDGV